MEEGKEPALAAGEKQADSNSIGSTVQGFHSVDGGGEGASSYSRREAS
jgi:hypothetical protein